jgi:hypothetical protein
MGVETLVLAGVSAAMQYSEGQQNANAMRAQANFNQIQDAYRQELIEKRQAEIVKFRDSDIEKRGVEISQVISSQKTALAASGIVVDGDLGDAFEEDAIEVGRRDVETIKNNAWKESMGLADAGMSQLLQSQSDQMVANSKASNSEMGGLFKGLVTVGKGVNAYRREG